MTTPNDSTTRDERTMGEVFADLTGGFSELLRDEVALAKAELRRGITVLVRDAIFLAIGTAIALAAVLTFIDAAVFGLGLVMPLWASALIVGGVFLIVALALILKGIQDLRRGEFLPKQTMESLRNDARWARERVR